MSSGGHHPPAGDAGGLAVDAGAELVVFTCSSTSPLIDTARRCHQVPILKIDDPMAERAVRVGKRIGVLCTTNSTVPSSELLAHHAARLGQTVAVEAVLVDSAFAALQRGDCAEHDELVQAAAENLAARTDVIVLAQASMAHLTEPLAARLPLPVLASPPILMEALRERLPSPERRRAGSNMDMGNEREWSERNAAGLGEVQHPLGPRAANGRVVSARLHH